MPLRRLVATGDCGTYLCPRRARDYEVLVSLLWCRREKRQEDRGRSLKVTGWGVLPSVGPSTNHGRKSQSEGPVLVL